MKRTRRIIVGKSQALFDFDNKALPALEAFEDEE
jgi:arabinogalactan endo-1,4-beta-galactosidase